jgi:hypothetical protein
MGDCCVLEVGKNGSDEAYRVYDVERFDELKKRMEEMKMRTRILMLIWMVFLGL